MKKTLYAALMLLVSAGASAAEPYAAGAVRDALARAKVPSMSVARISAGRVDFVAAYGDQSPGVPATPRTLYNIASLTKPITAEVFLRLASRHKIGLDEPMSDAWTDPDLIGDPRAKLLTPRIALSHRTGFANWRRMTGGKLSFAYTPGQGYGYSGEGFEYLARFAEKKGGARIDALARQLVFAPIGMRDTAHTEQPWFKDRVAVPSRNGAFTKATFAAEPGAADDVYTTASDYAKFLAALTRGKGLTPAIARERTTILVDQLKDLCNPKQPDTCPVTAGFGLGWQVLNFKDRTYLMHTGSDGGEFTLAFWSPTTRNGGVILTNSNNGPAAIVATLDRFGFDPVFVRFLRALAEK